MWIFRDANYNFLGLRRKAYIFSAVVIGAGLLSIAAHGGLRAGVEFTGGTLLQIQFHQPTDIGELRRAVTDAGFEGGLITQFGGANEFIVRVPAFGEAAEEGVTAAIERSLAGVFGADVFDVIRVEAVGPRVGGELTRNAILAILLSFVLTLIYLAFRFEWRFGVASVAATVHDIVITFGIISLLNIEITLATVAAILTIVGYSLNDTIVVFDRVRENLRKKKKEPFIDTLNRGINDTLPRTVLTSGTTLVALLALYILGGPVIKPFALVLILGILIGTYSSIFVASPALLEIHRYGRRRAARAPAGG